MSAIRGYMYAEAGTSGLILAAREHLNSLSDSSMEEIKQAIRAVPFLDNYYEMGENYIRTKNRRVSYGFAGLRHNLDSIKSKARILLCWVDEAETVSEMAWRKLLPTVREDDSEVWITWNPESRDSATSQRFRYDQIFDEVTGELIGVGAQLNYSDNPWFPEVLEIERRQDQNNLDDATYRWIWEGDFLELSEAQIFRNKYKVEEFEPQPDWVDVYYGADWGFAKDPTTLNKIWVHDDVLYIEHEVNQVGCEIDHLPKLFDAVPGVREHKIRADSARPETISYLKRQGFKIEAAEKGAGSVEDGITYLKKFKKIVIHPRCTETAREFRLYSYKVNRAGDVLPVILDMYNHHIDAIRYALQPLIKGRSPKKPATAGNRIF